MFAMQLAWVVFAALSLPSWASSTRQPSEGHIQRATNGIHLPIYRQDTPSVRKRGLTGAIGLGNFMDVTYNVLVTVGGVSTPVVLDTGSSDLWIISDACTACSKSLPLYPQATFESANLDARLLYGDSQSGTHAFGLIGKDTIDLAGLTLANQYFAAINDTNTTVLDAGSAGILGLGFPVNSAIWSQVFVDKHSPPAPTKREADNGDGGNIDRLSFPGFSLRIPEREVHRASSFSRVSFPNVSELFPQSRYEARQASSSAMAVFESYPTIAPPLSRLVAMRELAVPMFTVALQRDTVDVGGNIGSLSVGALPDGIKNESLTWVPVRTYTVAQGGLPPPPDFPDEQYPIAWEVLIDDVFLDGEKLPRSTLAPSSIALSGLMDTGNSLLRGPADVVQHVLSKLGANFPCSEPHTISFQIGGKMLPVDSRDFVNQAFVDSVNICSPNLVATDPPAEGQYLYSWSLGDPFLKSVLSSYYFGNLSHPSQDPPRIGFLSTVPADADDRLKAAVKAAASNGGNFPALSEEAPTGTRTAATTDGDGIAEAKATSTAKVSGSAVGSRLLPAVWAWVAVVFSSILVFVLSCG